MRRSPASSSLPSGGNGKWQEQCKRWGGQGKEVRKDMAGYKQPNGRLTAISYSHTNHKGWAIWDCRCDCGSELKIAGLSLRSGASRSCGCLRRKECSARSQKWRAFGEEKSIAEWAKDKRCTVSEAVLRERLRRGCDEEKAIRDPLRQRQLRQTEYKPLSPSGRGIPLKELLCKKS
jgi:hypothetical protein